MIKYIETLGTILGIIGALLVACKMGQYGYPFFLTSSACLLFSAWKMKQINFIKLQGVFFTTNIIGLFNYM